MFQINEYQWKFLRTLNGMKMDTRQQAKFHKNGLSCIRNVSEMTVITFESQRITVAEKPTKTLIRMTSKPKENSRRTDAGRNVIHKIKYEDCDKCYIDQSGRRLAAHTLATRRHDPLSLISLHGENERHAFNLDMVNIIDQANSRYLRELLNAWH